MRIVFLGTPDFAKKSLEKLVESGQDVIAVVTNPDKPKGRGGKMTYSDVKEYALEKDLKILQPLKVRKNEEFLNEIRELEPDCIVVVAYGKILPKSLLDIPKLGAINVHGSLLPELRGAAPIQWAVLNGMKKTGITTMFMDEGMDTGDMILQEAIDIGDNETTGELWDRMGNLGAKLLIETIEKLEEVKNANPSSLDEVKQKMNAKPQKGDFTLAPMLEKEMGKLDWTKSTDEIHNLVRGLNPIMGTFTFWDDKKIKIWRTEKNIDSSEKSTPGEVLNSDKNGLIIATGDGSIKILELQGENAKKMDYKSFLNGNLIPKGTLLK